MTIVGSPENLKLNLYGVGFAGGTLVAAGDGGEIYTSVDGKNAYLQPAAGAQATTGWRAVGVADATHALVGGSGGALVKSTSANAIPDTTPPTGTIGGPSSVQAGHVATFTASLADEAGGSGVDPASLAWTTPGATGVNGTTTAHFTFTTTGFHTITLTFRDRAGNAASATASVFVTPATPGSSGGGTPANAAHPVVKTSGGARITLYKTIHVGKGRTVPVRISTKVPRNFVLEILTSKRPYHHVSTLKTSLRKGSKTVKIKLPRKLKNGTYLIVVRVFKGKHGLGRSIRQAFIITS
jgi:methionine-rich copper-binding protein CopC